MNPSRLFILRPIATSLVMVAILLAGLMGYHLLPVSALPEVDYPTIQVTTLYPGASPEVMTSLITAPLERQFGQMPGLDQMSSSSSGGASVITLQFNLTLSLDVAEQEVQAAINAASSFLPQDLPMPPIYSKVNPADAPILTLAITSTTLPLPSVEDWVDTRLAAKLSQLSGVGLVSIGGGQRPAVRIQANPNALASYGLNLEDVRTAVGNANVNQAKGSFDGPLRASSLDANDQLKSADDYRRLILAYRNGAAIRMGDVADVVEQAENTQLAAWAATQHFDGEMNRYQQTPAIILNIQRQPGANVIKTVDRIKQMLPQVKATLPSAIDIAVLTDRTETIRASVKDVHYELGMSIALVIMVIFLFLRNARATLIPSVVVPLSLIGTFGVMTLIGFSLNNLTLMALTIATGFVVDDAIVMIENISRYVEQGDSPLEAALKGSEQVGFTIISLTISLIAVLIPLLFMGDIIGRLFREFAVTLSVAILISAFVSLTLTPMMCAKLLRPISEEHESVFSQKLGEFMDKIIAVYGKMLNWVLERQAFTLWVAIATLLLTVALYIVIPKGFFPLQDTGMIQAIVDAPQSVSFTAMAERQHALVDTLIKDPAIESLSSFVGVDGINTTLNSGRLLINLKPKAARVSISEVIERLKAKTASLPGLSIYMQPVQDLTIENRVSRTQYQFNIAEADIEKLSLWVPKLEERMRQLPELVDVASDLQNQGLQAYISVNRDTASQLGLTMAVIDNALYNAFGQRLISTIFTQSNVYRVVLEVQPNLQQAQGMQSALENFHIVSPTNGKAIPLSAFANVSERHGPLLINHVDQFPAATLSFNLAPGVALGEAVNAIRAAEQQMNLPESMQTRFQGAAASFQSSQTNTLLLILAAMVTMYIVLGVLYESTIHPVTILSTLPSAGVGALLALMVSGKDLGVIGIIGIILLIGIVKKNAILMIDFALEAERKHGKTPREAIFEACLLRFRPILMTTLAALFGALPLMLGSGVGSELRHPLGITMVGGLLFSQVLTLFTTPVIYLSFDRLRRRWWTNVQAA